MKKVNISGQRVRAVCASALALTLAIPTTLYVNTAPVEAADSVLDTAVVTYDFESEEGLTFEGEQQLKLEDGKPVLSDDGTAYETVASTALPSITEDDTKGKVLTFEDSVDVKKYEKTEDDAKAAAEKEGKTVSEASLNIKYPVGSLLQQEERLGGRVKIDNPFKGKTFDYETGGISISYWVKVPEIYVDTKSATGDKVAEPTSSQISNKEVVLRGANSTTVVFNNSDRLVLNKDDNARYQACLAYDAALEKGDEETLKDYSMGKPIVATDSEGNAYIVYKNVDYELLIDSDYDTETDPNADEHYGKLIRFNPNYPSAEVSAQAASAVTGNGKVMGAGWFVPPVKSVTDRKTKEVTYTDGDQAKIQVTDSEGHTFKICSLANLGSSSPDEGQYQYFRYRYKADGKEEEGYSSKSKIREGSVKGSLQITTDNDFGFRADNYRTESYTDEDNKVQTKAVDGVRLDNPNRDDYHGKIIELDSYNQLFFDGDEFVTSTTDTWHYVTIVIQNDWVITYVDGVAANPEENYKYMKTAMEASGKQGLDFSYQNTGKTFNKGLGLRKPFSQPSDNVSEWSSDGTANASPANSLSITMLDWISDQNTELYLGGTGFASECLTQGFGTVKDVCLDDVSFFDKALTEEQAVQLYKEARSAAGMSTVQLGDVNEDGKINLTDAQWVLRAYLKTITLTDAQIEAADVNKDGKVNLTDAQKILKVYLRIESSF